LFLRVVSVGLEREEDVERLAGIVKSEKVVLYARVSSSTQRDDLERQVKALEE
jgi:predicted site-specific integrase-resolvase